MKQIFSTNVFSIASLFLLLIAVPACGAPKEGTPCGSSPSDWCVTEGDRCATHKNVDECRSDLKCAGLQYIGESMVRCLFDERNFGTNCPTVGCVTACSELSHDDCTKAKYRCYWGNNGCEMQIYK